jgi:hypothetical protein
MKAQLLFIGGISLIFAGGFTAGYAFAKQRLEKEYDARLEEEVGLTKKYYSKLSKKDQYDDPTKLVKGDEEGISTRMPEELLEEITETVTVEEFIRDRTEQFNYRTEIPKRDPKVAYVISYDEYMENPKQYDQRTLTYFSKDDVVVEERDQPLDDPLGILGPVALDSFGHGSKDPNIVYVRNDRLAMDFEICFDPDSFEETVLGLKHSGEVRKVRKFRIDDD